MFEGFGKYKTKYNSSSSTIRSSSILVDLTTFTPCFQFSTCLQLLSLNPMFIQPNLPWVVLGDFNVVLHNDEKKGLPPRRSSMLEFLNWYNNCDLQLSDRVGLKYTWCNNQHGSGRILARLDRVFYNQAWIQKFGGWRYKVGSREGSDHAPLLGAVAHIPGPHNVPFRFNQAWTSHKEFKDFIKCSWPPYVEGSPIFRMNKKLRMLKESLKTWNLSVFGNIEQVVNKAQAVFALAQAEADNDPTNDRCKTEMEEKEEALLLARKNRSTFWKMMSKDS
ncbi:hypothetical protein IFM89_020391 [Coptis chinensis]|uniref:Endonuclease/exonuclease/phosphatase domain-containing protein n=1 Tax=Coptis chinensis TaxID=261450 RepID=A0A835IR27_9MAGN|nr:hypothetical protein IFM89_020391 [Coptis chinensis]